MNFEEGSGGQEMASIPGASSPRELSMKLKIERSITSAQERLDAAKRAREILDKHPELEELLNLLRRF